MKRLLVIDDSPTIRKVVEITLRKTGWDVTFAASGADGIQAASQQTYDLVLLDYVLPDMRGLDVCSRLAANEATARLPLLLLTAKADDIRRLFQPYPAVRGFIKKPFTSDELLARVSAVLGEEPLGRGRFTHAQGEAAAKAVYARLARVFAFIPSWCAQMGAQAPASFFARKILTPEVIGDLLEIIASTQSEASATGGLSGELSDWSPADLLALLGSSGRTGTLRFNRPNGPFYLAYFRAGELVLVTSSNPADHAEEGAPSDVRAEAEQRTTGKPTWVTLSEAGAIPPAAASEVIHRVGRALLQRVLESRDLRFAWSDAAPPSWVTSFGKYLSLPRKTLLYARPEGSPSSSPPASMSLADLALERARAAAAGVESSWPTADRVLTRVRGFSTKIQGLALSPVERRILACVNDRTTLREIAARCSLPENEGRRIAHVLNDVGLLAPDTRPRPVLILEPDGEGFSEPLASLLSGRSTPVPLISLENDTELVSAVLREKPSMVILNAGATADPNATARALRSHDVLAGVSLVALLDLPSAMREPELRAAGFDAVLIKPVPYAALEDLIGP
jgi:DNA-binding response OmpR family regulator